MDKTNPLISRIRTTEERDSLIAEIDILLAAVYEHKGAGLDSALKNRVRYWVAELIRGHIPPDPDAAENYLRDLKDRLTGLKTLGLRIAFEPTDSTIDKLISYVRKSITKEIILDVEIDPGIFGGAQITYMGEFRDFSLKRLFEEEYKKKESELATIVKRPVGK